MRILIFNWRDIKNPSAGGAEVVTHEHAKRWVKAGHKVTLFCAAFTRGKKEETIDGVKIIRQGNRYTVYWHAFRCYRKHFRGNFDLIIDEINTLPFFTPLYVKEPVIAFIHQFCRKIWFYESKLPIAIIGYLIEPFCLKIYRKIPVMTVSQSSKKDLLSLGFKEERVHIIPEGIDFKPLTKVSEKEKYPTLVYVGRLKKSKRIYHILKAFSLIKKEKPEARLWLIGNGDPYKKKLQKLVKKMCLQNVVFWGFQEEKEKLSLIGKAHVIVMASVKEGWGLAITEANAVGTPAVVYDVDGLRDSTKDYITGIFCLKNNPHSLAKTILKLLNDEQFRTSLSRNALKWARKFSWERSAKESLKILEKLGKTITLKRRKNVVLVSEMAIPPVSRANLRTYRIGLALLKKGYNVSMITPSKTPFQRKSYSQERIFMNQFWGFSRYLYSPMRSIIRFYHLLGTIASILWLQIRWFKIDFIHAWNPLAGLAAAIAGKILRRPVYIDFTDFYSDIAQTDLPLAVPILRAIERYILSAAAKVFVVSEEMVKALVDSGVKKEKLYIVPDGVDSKMFHPSISGKKIRRKFGLGDSPVIIYHGDIKEPDGVDLLCQSFTLILKKVPEAKLLIVGGGRGRYFRRLSKIVKKLGIGDSIRSTGWVPHEEIPEYIAASDVGAMPMRATLNHNCYLSFKLFEYWAMGKPVVVSRLKAISKIVKNGVNGYIFEPEDIEEMAEAYIKILTNAKKAKKMGEAGRKLVEKGYDWDRLMEIEANLYESSSS